VIIYKNGGHEMYNNKEKNFNPDMQFVTYFSLLKRLYIRRPIISDVLSNISLEPSCLNYYKILIDELNDTLEKDEAIKLINTCLYVFFKVLPTLLKKDLDEYLKTLEKEISRVKASWSTSVNYYLRTNNDKKYILKKIKQVPSIDTSSIKNNDEIVIAEKKVIATWKNSKTELLSDFIYFNDLTYKQQLSMTQFEIPYIIVKEMVVVPGHPLLLHLKQNIKTKKDNEKISIPPSLLKVKPQFGYKRKKLKDYKHREIGGQLHLYFSDGGTEVLDAVEVILDDNNKPIINVKEDTISSNSGHLSAMVDLLKLGSVQILEGKSQVTILLQDICELRGIKPLSKNYKKIFSEYSLLMKKTLSIGTEEEPEIIGYINRLKMSNKGHDQKMRLIVDINKGILEDIWSKRDYKIYMGLFYELNDLERLLVRLLIYDYQTHKDDTIIIYDWFELATSLDYIDATVTNKIKRDNLHEAFKKIKDHPKSVLSYYASNKDKTKFKISYDHHNIFKPLDALGNIVDNLPNS